jgi:GR25 family glycosyltransferase involved in LPS biosynthesis
MQAYVINLDRDTKRMAKMRTALGRYPFIVATRISGVRGSDLPDIASEILTTKAAMKDHKGTLGCSLSHVSAWEAIARSEAQWSLILEDDGELLDSIESLRDLDLPADVDLVYCNGRMVYQDSGMDLLPIVPAFDFMVRNRTAVGSDAYLLSREGAAKLLQFFARDGFYSHVDLRVAAYGLTLEEMETLPQRQYVIRDICTLRRIYDYQHHINARVLGTAITKHVKEAPSSRQAEDKRRSPTPD